MGNENTALVETMSGELITSSDGPTALEVAGQVANAHAATAAFGEYRALKATSTLRAQDAALNLFSDFLHEAGAMTNGDDLVSDPTAWRGVTVGLVKGFRNWQRNRGYSIASINARLSHVRTYANLATQAGVIPPGEGVKIQSVAGYTSQEGARVDEKREAFGVDTRVSTKKSEPVGLTEEQAEALLDQPDTAQGRRDAVLMHLILKHGLRVSEVEALNVSDITITRKDKRAVSGLMKFYRPKLAGTQYEWGEHVLTGETLQVVARYLERDAVALGPLMRSSRKGGALTSPGMTRRSLSVRVKRLGERVGVEGLTAHDCRHYAATRDGKRGKSVKYVMTKFGWTSAQTAMRYVHQEGPVIVD